MWNTPSISVIRGSSTPYSSSAWRGAAAARDRPSKCQPVRAPCHAQVRDVREVVGELLGPWGEAAGGVAVADRPRVDEIETREVARHVPDARCAGGPGLVSRNAIPTSWSGSQTCRAAATESGLRRRPGRPCRAPREGRCRAGRSATRTSRIVSSPSFATPGLIVEITSNPGCDGCDVGGGDERVLGEPLDDRHGARARRVRSFFGGVVLLDELAHHVEEPCARLRPRRLVRVRVRVVLQPCLQLGVVEQRGDGLRHLVGGPEPDQEPAVVGERLLRVEVRRGDDRLAGAERVGQRAAGDLVRVEVRRDVDVGGEQVLDDVLLLAGTGSRTATCSDEAEAPRPARRAGCGTPRRVACSSSGCVWPAIRYRASGWSLHDRRHRLDHVLQALARAHQPERRDDLAARPGRASPSGGAGPSGSMCGIPCGITSWAAVTP